MWKNQNHIIRVLSVIRLTLVSLKHLTGVAKFEVFMTRLSIILRLAQDVPYHLHGVGMEYP